MEMIVSFKHRGLKRFFEKDDSSKLPPMMIGRIANVLADLDAATTIKDLDSPVNRLHRLTGDRKSQWSITVRSNWRIVFEFENGNAHIVDFIDYH